ncbi:four-carbon acid sugar kinase family protein [Neobacillus cucumis]|nr:nucleotide-binding domain containing protein [Neobacillus cucumis]
MNGADLRNHLRKQLEADIGLMDINELSQDGENVKEQYFKKIQSHDILLLDALNHENMRVIGRLLWEKPNKSTQFVVGSSGVEYALASCWRDIGIPTLNFSNFYRSGTIRENVLVVSGSCSMITHQQIANALSNGFHGIRIPIHLFTNNQQYLKSFIEEVVELLIGGKSVILYTALGSRDGSIGVTREHLNALGIQPREYGHFIGKQLGILTNEIMNKCRIGRLVLAGGDTSGFITKELGIYGLEMIHQVSPGAPLCRTYSDNRHTDQIELALKGGQLGGKNYFEDLLKLNMIRKC